MIDESGKLSARVELAKQVRRPMTFFTLALFLSVGALLTMYIGTSDPVPLEAGIVMSVLAACPSVSCICVLLWAKAKIKQNPHAFDDE